METYQINIYVLPNVSLLKYRNIWYNYCVINIKSMNRKSKLKVEIRDKLVGEKLTNFNWR